MPRQRRHSGTRDGRGPHDPATLERRARHAGADKFVSSLGNAVDDFWRATASEQSVRNHLLGVLAMLVCLFVVQPAPVWWGVCLFASGLLVALEAVNTAIERLADHLAPQKHPAVVAPKDIAAAAVVAASIGVLVLGV